MLLYDNLEDVKTKLVGTFCYYEGKAVLVKAAYHHPQDIQKYVLDIVNVNSRAKKTINIDDPLFNYMKFNLGYTNHLHSAVWWYRVPQRQYKQGLKADQMGVLASKDEYRHRVEFNFNRIITDMMENVYPQFDEIEKLMKDGEAQIMAFNKDFAVSWDKIHNDYIVEYKGKFIGCLASKNNFQLMDEYKHLTEAFKEAVA